MFQAVAATTQPGPSAPLVDGGGLESASAAVAGAPGRVAQPDGAGSPHAQPAKHVESHALAAASQLTACPAQEQSQASNPQDSPQASQPSAHSQGACPPPQPTIASAATFARAGCLTARAFTDFRGRPQPPTHRCSASQALSLCSSFTTSPKRQRGPPESRHRPHGHRHGTPRSSPIGTTTQWTATSPSTGSRQSQSFAERYATQRRLRWASARGAKGSLAQAPFPAGSSAIGATGAHTVFRTAARSPTARCSRPSGPACSRQGAPRPTMWRVSRRGRQRRVASRVAHKTLQAQRPAAGARRAQARPRGRRRHRFPRPDATSGRLRLPVGHQRAVALPHGRRGRSVRARHPHEHHVRVNELVAVLG